MSFRRIPRRLVDQPKPFPVQPDGIVLQWKDDAPSPCLTIYIGYQLAREIGIRGTMKRAQLYLGFGGDSGKCGLRAAPDGDIRIQSHRDGYRIHLPCHISVEHFTFCKRTAVRREAIEIREDLLIFAYEGIRP